MCEKAPLQTLLDEGLAPLYAAVAHLAQRCRPGQTWALDQDNPIRSYIEKRLEWKQAVATTPSYLFTEHFGALPLPPEWSLFLLGLESHFKSLDRDPLIREIYEWTLTEKAQQLIGYRTRRERRAALMQGKKAPLEPRTGPAPVIFQAELFPADGTKTLRWRDRQQSWQRVDGERFNASRYHVAAVKVKEVCAESVEIAEKEEGNQGVEGEVQEEEGVIEGQGAKGAEEKKMTAEAQARAFVKQHHYSRTCSVASQIYSLYEGDELIGVAVLGIPAPVGTSCRRFFPTWFPTPNA